MPRHAPVPLAEVDLSDIDGFNDGRGYAQLDTLRAEDPVHWTEEKDGTGFWAVTRYEDIWPSTATRTRSRPRSSSTSRTSTTTWPTSVARCWRPTASGTRRCAG